MTIVQSKYTLNNEKCISGNEKACFKMKCALDAMKKSASNDLRNPQSKTWSEICVVYNEKCALYNKKSVQNTDHVMKNVQRMMKLHFM